MKKILDELNEIIYIVELETYNLLYLNTYGLNLFGYKNFDEVKNYKCFEVFYRQNSPCSFCNVNHINEYEYYEWECKNPIVNRYFSVKEKLINWNGKLTHLALLLILLKKKMKELF